MGMIYAIHNVTKRHFLVDEGARNWDGPVGEYHFAEADADGWIAWEGGECPLPDGAGVQVKTSSGIRNAGLAYEFRWAKQSRSGDIVAYRPIFTADSGSVEGRCEECEGVGGHIGDVCSACGGSGESEPSRSRGHGPEACDPEVVEWDGEGDPPVGVVCEARNYHNRSAFEKAMVVHRTRKGVTLVEYEDGDAGFLTAPADFRPIRSEEGRSIDEMIMAAGLVDDGYNREVCRDLYLAGCRMMGGKR